MLYSLAALQVLEMDLSSWNNLYTDLPSKQQKVSVKDKSSVVCSEDETSILQPAAMQADLDQAMCSVS
jgi:phosphoacetylglucosamine mutase